MRSIRRILGQSHGQDLIEYALLGSAIALFAAVTVQMLGTRYDNWYVALGTVGQAGAAAMPAGDWGGENSAGNEGGGRGRGGGRGGGSNCSATGIAASRGTCQ